MEVFDGRTSVYASPLTSDRMKAATYPVWNITNKSRTELKYGLFRRNIISR